MLQHELTLKREEVNVVSKKYDTLIAENQQKEDDEVRQAVAMGDLNESFREIGNVNKGLRLEVNEMVQEIERIKSESKEKEEALRKELQEMKKQKENVEN